MSAPIRLADLAQQLGRPVEGDAGTPIRGVASLEAAGVGDLVYVREPRFAAALRGSKASAVIAPEGLDTGGLPTIRSANPSLDFARVVRRLLPEQRPEPGVHAAAFVDPSARVDPSAYVGPGCAVGRDAAVGARSVLHANVTLYSGVSIGADSTLHAGCVLREGTVLGDRVTLQPGVVLGAEGFGYVANDSGAFEATPQLGRVVVEDDVEIGANTTVDRGSLGETRVRRGAKLDNLVMVAHGVDVGEDAMLVAQAGVAGSARIGRGAIVFSQAGIADHVEIGEGAYVGPQTGVTGDVGDGEQVLGTPHDALPNTRRTWVLLRRLPELARRLRALERKLGRNGGSAR